MTLLRLLLAGSSLLLLFAAAAFEPVPFIAWALGTAVALALRTIDGRRGRAPSGLAAAPWTGGFVALLGVGALLAVALWIGHGPAALIQASSYRGLWPLGVYFCVGVFALIWIPRVLFFDIPAIAGVTFGGSLGLLVALPSSSLAHTLGTVVTAAALVSFTAIRAPSLSGDSGRRPRRPTSTPGVFAIVALLLLLLATGHQWTCPFVDGSRVLYLRDPAVIAACENPAPDAIPEGFRLVTASDGVSTRALGSGAEAVLIDAEGLVYVTSPCGSLVLDPDAEAIPPVRARAQPHGEARYRPPRRLPRGAI